MAPVALSFVVRFSSEDSIFKAENLCKGKAGATGTWKVAKEDANCGRIEAEFQLEKASYISHIDIGNCGSAFIEVMVGNSMWPQDKPYVTLLPSAMLMSPTECKHWTKTHTVRMFNQNAFSKQALGSQWDRLRVICCQPYRKDKQFGLSFMRLEYVSDDPTPSPPEGASGKTTTPTSGHLSGDETDEDGVMRLKKTSGLMGCLRKLEKGSPEIPLNRAEKMLQAALDRSPGTPRNNARNKRSLSQSSTEISSSPESPYMKKNPQLPSEGPSEKKKKEGKKWSLSGDIHDEVALFLEEIDFTKMDLHSITFKDLRNQMEQQRGCPLTKLEKKVFLKMAKATIEKLVPSQDDPEDVVELPRNEPNHSATSKKTVIKEPSDTKKQPNTSASSKTVTSQERGKRSKKEPKNKESCSPQPSTSIVSTPEIKSQRIDKPPQLIPVDEIQDSDFPSSSSRILVDDDEEELPTMLYSSEGEKSTRRELFYSGEFKPLPDKDESTTSLVECPLCGRFFPAKEVEFHASLCTGDAGDAPVVVEPKVELMQCPICSKLFPLTQIEQHADECVDVVIAESSNTLRREPLVI